MAIRWVTGHGTENDFVLIPDADGELHLTEEWVAEVCGRFGTDGLIRVVRSTAAYPADFLARFDLDAPEWFMDYYNADGSLSEMCGNGIRVYGRHLAEEGLIDTSGPVPILTRDGVKTLMFEGDLISVDMGEPPEIGGFSEVRANGRAWKAREVHTGNPHAVVFVESLADAGPLDTQPEFDESVYPEGVNIEFVHPLAADHIEMRVHERGSGETRSCGTGACAAAVAHLGAPGRSRVDVPGGTLWVDWAADGQMTLTGPAVLTDRGVL